MCAQHFDSFVLKEEFSNGWRGRKNFKALPLSLWRVTEILQPFYTEQEKVKWRATCIPTFNSSGGKKFLRGNIWNMYRLNFSFRGLRQIWIRKKKEQEFVIHRKKNQLVSKSLSLSSSVSKHQRSRLARLDGPITGTRSWCFTLKTRVRTGRLINSKAGCRDCDN